MLGEAEAVRLGEEGWILPKPLRAHAPGGIVKNGITGTDRRFITAKHLPRQSDPWLKGGPIPVDSRRITDTILTGNQKLARAASLRDVICHTVMDFRDGTGEVPRQTEIQRQISGNSPIILDKRAEDFPAAPGDRTIECLIVVRDAYQAEHKIRLSVTGNVHGVRLTARLRAASAAKSTEITDGARDPESVLEGLGTHVHLVRAYRSSDLNVMLAANHVEGVAKREDVGSTLERRVAAITEGPKGAKKERRNQPAAVSARRAGRAAVGTAQVRAGDAARHDLIGLATPGALRFDVIKNPVVTKTGLVDRVGRKHVSLADRYLARMVDNSLIAPECVSLGKSAGEAARNEGDGVVVAKTQEQIIAGR